jgi:hypothetical protein
VCSGHGTCESIKEIAARDFSNVYKLWDEDSTMGCVCDGGYTGSDCSERICKFGADPLYYDDMANVRISNFTYQFYTRTQNAVLTGNYSLTFFDAYGENWQTRAIDWNANCDTVIAALEELPNNAIPANSVRCYKSVAPGGTPGSTTGQDATIDPITDAAMYVYSKYTLAFPGNPGHLPQISINKFLDGNRPTLYTDETPTSTLGWHIYPNGFIGEDVDMVPDLCEDVLVTLSVGSAGVYFHKLGGLTTASAKLLKKCLGDSDGNSANNVDTYDWDYGTAANPHLIKLVDATQDTSIVTVDNSGDADVDNQLAKYPVSTLCNSFVPTCHDRDRPGFFAVIYYDGTDFQIFTRAAKDFASTTQFYVYTTKGHLQLVNTESAAFTTSSGMSDETKIGRYHSNVVHLIAGSANKAGYLGELDCETTGASVGTDAYTLDCLKKDDYVMLFTSHITGRTAAELAANPAYPNMYRVKKISREPMSTVSIPSYEAERHQVVLDYSLNADYRYVSGFADNTDTSARFYKFYPPPAANQYAYAGECSHRGICNTKTGLCQCFPGYSSDNCGEVNAMSH